MTTCCEAIEAAKRIRLVPSRKERGGRDQEGSAAPCNSGQVEKADTVRSAILDGARGHERRGEKLRVRMLNGMCSGPVKRTPKWYTIWHTNLVHQIVRRKSLLSFDF